MANIVEPESSWSAQASSHARAVTSTPVNWSHGLYIHAHPLQSINLIVLVFTSPTASNQPPPPKGQACGMRWWDTYRCNSQVCGSTVGHNGWVYLMQWWGHVGHDGWACGKMQWLGVWDTMVRHMGCNSGV